MLRSTKQSTAGAIRLYQLSLRNFHSPVVRQKSGPKYRKPKTKVLLKDGDFTNYEILPYLQAKINDLINPTDAKYAIENTEPTADQRKLLSILQSNYSVLQRGETQTGKTLALITYLLNVSLSKTPNYKYLTAKGHGYDSVVIVPTDELVDKYKSLIEFIMAGIPEECCPGELILENKESFDRKYSLTRVPLTVDFLYSNKPHTQVTSSRQPHRSLKTQMIVTTLSQFEQIMEGKNHKLTMQGLSNIKTLAVDDFDLFLKTTDLDGDCLVETYGKKGKYRNIMETQIKKLQDFHLNTFKTIVNRRLERTKEIHKEDPRLTERLEKESRRVLYKPIQYCFLANNNEPYKQMLAMKTNTNKIIAANQTIESQQNVHSDSSYHNALNQNYVNLLKKKGTKNINKIEDPQNAFVEKLIRFNDDQREFKKNERPLITVGNYGESKFANMNTYLTIGMANNKPPNEPIMKDIVWKLKPNHSINKIMDKQLEISENNPKNLEKSFLKYKYIENSQSDYQQTAALINSTIVNFRNRTDNFASTVVIVPNSIDVNKISLALNELQPTEPKIKFAAYDSSQSLTSSDDTYLVMRSSQLIGQSLLGFSNMIVASLDACLYQTALARPCSSTKDNITGINDPIGSLIPYYMSKLNSSTSNETNLVLTFNGLASDQNIFNQDLKKISELIFYNNIPQISKIQTLTDDLQLRRKIPIGIDEKFATQIKTALQSSKSKEKI